jgi:hypothetical protein
MKYRLLKPLPNVAAGTLFFLSDKLGKYIPDLLEDPFSGTEVSIDRNGVKDKNWFEEVKNPPARILYSVEPDRPAFGSPYEEPSWRITVSGLATRELAKTKELIASFG